MNELRSITDAEEYFKELNRCKEEYLICVAVRDNVDGMQPGVEELVREFGLKEIRTVGWCSYVFVSDRGDVLLNKAGVDHHPLVEKVEAFGIQIVMVTKSWRAGKKLSICLDEYEMAVKGEGLNIVVFDAVNRILLDSVCFTIDRNNGGRCKCSRLQEYPEVPFPRRKSYEEKEDDVFDIDLEMDKIIEKFQLDEYYPQYGNKRKAEKAIRELASTWGENESIACITIGENPTKAKHDELYFSGNLTDSQRLRVDFLYFGLKTKMGTDLYNLDANCRAGDYKEFKNIRWDTFTRIYIISNHGDNYLGYWFRKQNIEYTNLYDYLLLYGVNNVSTDMEYYDFIVDKRDYHFVEMDREMDPLYWEIYEEQQRYKMYSSAAYRQVIAKKLFFLAIVLRDFSFAETWMEEITKNGGRVEHYKKAWNDIQLLLHVMREKLKERKQKDIIALWVDQVEYSLVDENMPFVSSLKEKGIWFDNYFTATGFTRESVRTLFTGKKLIDDSTNEIQKLDFFNSKVLQELMKYNYRVLIHGGYFRGLLTDFTENFRMHFNEAPRMLWGTLRQMLKTNSTCFVLNHILSEPHEPSLSTGTMDEHLSNWWQRKTIGCRYVDRQIQFYIEMLGENATSVIFSDHGYHVFYPRQHIFMAIYGGKYVPKKIMGLCSSVEFPKIVGQLLKFGDIREEELCHDIIEFQGTTILRGGKFISPSGTIREAVPAYNPPFRGYRGIITEDYVYIHFGGGREWLSRRNPLQPVLSWYERPDDIYDVSLLPKMRRLAGIDYRNEPPDYGPRSEFYLSLQEQIEMNYPYNRVKIILVNELVRRIPGGGIAIYVGNQAAREFYLMLSLENRKKIVGVIDANQKCLCSDLNMPIFPLSEAVQKDVKSIIVTTRVEDAALKKFVSESENGVHAYGLYGWFALNGYYTKFNFWDFVIGAADEKPAKKHIMPYFYHHASPKEYKIAVVLVTHDDEACIASALHRLQGEMPEPLKVYCLDQNSTDKTVEIIRDYCSIDSSISVDVLGQEKLHVALNSLLDELDEKFVMFLAPKANLHPDAISYLHSVAEQAKPDVAASWAAAEDSEEGKLLLNEIEKVQNSLKREATFLQLSLQERYDEWVQQDVSILHGLQLYSVDFLREHKIRFLHDDMEGMESLFLQAVLQAPKYIKTKSAVCVYGIDEGGRRTEKERFVTRYENNRRGLNRYRLWHHAVPLLPSFGELPILAVPFGRDSYTYIDKSSGVMGKIYAIRHTDQVQHAFFQYLNRPLLVKGEMNLCHWEYLYRNVRKSEDFGGDNHVYMYYETLYEFLLFLQVEDITPYLENEKMVFLFGERDLQENYPLNFESMYHIRYERKENSCLENYFRLNPADCWEKLGDSDFEDWLLANYKEKMASKDFRISNLPMLYGLYVDAHYEKGFNDAGGIVSVTTGAQ